MAHYKAHSRGGNVVFPLCPTCHTRYDKGLLTNAELKKLNLKREEYKKYQPKKTKGKAKKKKTTSPFDVKLPKTKYPLF